MPAGQHRVDLVIYPGFKSLEAVGPLTVFTYANKHLEEQGESAFYDIRIAASELAPVTSDTVIALQPTQQLDPDDLPDTALVAGAHDIETSMANAQGVIDWVQASAPSIRRFATLCTGTFFLAETGLLNGRRATTHWRMSDRLEHRYPAIDVDVDAIFIQQDNLWTSAGVSAAIDLSLAFVERDCGHKLALEVARDLVIFLKRPGGQSQFSADLASQMPESSAVRRIQGWAMDNLETPFTLGEMADQASLSIRHLTRLFQKETGRSPMEFVERARLDKARRLLQDTDLPLKSIAFRCGFSSDDQFRRTFRKYLSVVPNDYRSRFSSPN
ncbi:helix-turn-helix domain-containing protein [Marinobacter nanhaiticus D15-8W]|uniref:GlxA family transcriptional regulator n=1 Tax=Marinobacter nanhaiticus D15-8W TaxID=626887 RepID=N6W089_9GAMM|nr:GlxA family transcriptional regulator [Marinobacter nanhaiticus]ENO15945.1 GlxA family transcriptional regulator [Marinobacter nanhaiticus D15-8W]BES73197.1 helix-turn-helix domain-containing protein [Marinobacter nanhaiticus D15-8W]